MLNKWYTCMGGRYICYHMWYTCTTDVTDDRTSVNMWYTCITDATDVIGPTHSFSRARSSTVES